MISLPIRNTSGTEVGNYEFPPEDLAPGINKQLLHDVVVMYEANRRVGTVRTKSRGMVAGSSRKLYRQKGTGRARAGPIRTPVRRGGGHTFAKVPVDYSYRLPRKAVRLATRMALLSKFQDDQVTLLDELAVTEPRTKTVAGILSALGLKNTDCLLTIEAYDQNLWLSSRNIPTLRISPAAELNAYDLLRQRQLVITKAAIDSLRNKE
jgi:large subunit ribosomal protein L4